MGVEREWLVTKAYLAVAQVRPVNDWEFVWLLFEFCTQIPKPSPQPKAQKRNGTDPAVQVKINLVWLHKRLIGDYPALRTVGF
jgi:hypothetical protein